MCPAGSSTRSSEALSPSPHPPVPPQRLIAHLHTPLRQLRCPKPCGHSFLRQLKRSETGNEMSSRSCLTLTKGFHTLLFILKQSGAGIEYGENIITGKQIALDVLTLVQRTGSGRSARTEGLVAPKAVSRRLISFTRKLPF